MPVYNGEKFLKDAIDSILCQTFSDFELLIINDGSKDNSAKIVNSYSDSRIRFLENSFNLGLAGAKNRGIKEAQGKYIAWLDCDDISLPTRLEKQVNVLENDHSIGLCGTWVKTFGGNSTSEWRYPINPDYLRCRMIFDNPFTISSIMVRRRLLLSLDKYFDLEFPPAEDYELWERLSKVSRVSNIPEILTRYRFHGQQTSHSQDGIIKQKISVWKIQLKQLNELGINPSDQEKDLHLKIGVGWFFERSRTAVLASERWLSILKEANAEHKKYPEPDFSNVLGDRWFSVCSSATALGLWTWKTFRQSQLGKNNTIKSFSIIKFFIKCMIRKGDKIND
jgi:glycosyltransferase involved in cell wall biosynthesis